LASHTNLALFDFDGTLTHEDSLLEFLKFCAGTSTYYKKMLGQVSNFLSFKLKRMNNQTFKEAVLSTFFKGKTKDELQVLGYRFAEEKIPSFLCPEAIRKIEQHQEAKDRVIVVSASPELWLAPWTKTLGVELLASKLLYQGGQFTGKLDGKNCWGEEKVRRINAHLTLSDYPEIYAYGDSKGDAPMLALATKPFYRAF